MKACSEVCIVGNGASLLGRGLGQAIDEHECVVRFNEFKIVGFEQDVGRRTSVWFYNRDSEHPSIVSRLTQFRPVRMFVHEWNIADTAHLKLDALIKQAGTGTQAARVQKTFLKEMSEFLGERYSMWSSGAIAAWILLKEYPCVTLAGFDWWHKPDKFHYMNEQKFHYLPTRGHQPAVEKRFFDLLAAAGKVRFLYE